MNETGLAALDLAVTKLFDYAGMYPPASLSFVDALSHSAKFRTTLLRPFMCNTDLVLAATDLPKITDDALAAAGFSETHSLFFSTLGSSMGAQELAASDERLQELETLQSFNLAGHKGKPRRRAVSYEIKLAPDLSRFAEGLRVPLRNLLAFFSDDKIVICIEPDLSAAGWHADMTSCVALCAELNRTFPGTIFALKVRGSGPTAVNCEKLALIICAVCDNGLDFKATAGLHHPIVETARYANELGFLNLLIALNLRRYLGSAFSSDSVLQCLRCQDAGEFSCSGADIRWKEFLLPQDELRRLKQDYYFSIGSCSLSEPDADLQRLFAA